MTHDYNRTIADWQAKRLEHLTAEDGWLNVIGRYWLDDSVVRIGSADDNDIVLSAGPVRSWHAYPEAGHAGVSGCSGRC